MFDKIKEKINSLKEILVLKPEESFKEILTSLNYLEEEASNVYYESSQITSLYEYFVHKDRLNNVKAEIDEYQKYTKDIMRESYILDIKIQKYLIMFALLTLLALPLCLLGLHPLLALIFFQVNFFLSFRLASLSGKMTEVINMDKKSLVNAEEMMDKIERIMRNAYRNLEKRKDKFSKKKEGMKKDNILEAMEVLKNYLDYGSLESVDDDVIYSLIKILQVILKRDDDDLFHLLSLYYVSQEGPVRKKVN